MPTVLSMCQGGIWRAPTRDAIDFAHGRASSYEINDIGAMLSGRWHDSHFAWKIGAMSLVNVGVLALSAATAGSADTRRALTASAVVARNITGSFRACRPIRSIGHYTDLPDAGCCLSLSFSSARS